MKTQKINYQKFSNELKKLSYEVNPEKLEDLLKDTNLTKSKFKIKQIGKNLKKELDTKIKSNHLLEALSRSQFNENWHVLNKQIEEHHLFLGEHHFELDSFVMEYDMVLDYSTFDSDEEKAINYSFSRFMDNKEDIDKCMQFIFKRKKEYSEPFKYMSTRIVLKLWPKAITEMKRKLDSFQFKITIDDMKKVIQFYKDNYEKKEEFFSQGNRMVLLYGQTQPIEELASSELLNMYNYYNERINKKDLLSKYIEYKNKRKEYELKKENERKDFRKKHIFFNIWDDYSDEEDGRTFGQFEDDKFFLENEEEQEKASLIIRNEILKIFPNLDIKIRHNGLDFYNLDHETREELVERLKKSEATYRGFKFEMFSES